MNNKVITLWYFAKDWILALSAVHSLLKPSDNNQLFQKQKAKQLFFWRQKGNFLKQLVETHVQYRLLLILWHQKKIPELEFVTRFFTIWDKLFKLFLEITKAGAI